MHSIHAVVEEDAEGACVVGVIAMAKKYVFISFFFLLAANCYINTGNCVIFVKKGNGSIIATGVLGWL